MSINRKKSHPITCYIQATFLKRINPYPILRKPFSAFLHTNKSIYPFYIPLYNSTPALFINTPKPKHQQHANPNQSPTFFTKLVHRRT